jgi:hypothetical protein
MYALAFTITGFLSTFSEVRRLPPDVATTRVFPDFDFLAGLSTGIVMNIIPFRILAFMYYSFFSVDFTFFKSDIYPEIILSEVSALGGLAMAFNPVRKCAPTKANTARRDANHWHAALPN